MPAVVRPDGRPAVYLITGIQAAGKSTIAQALTERLPVRRSTSTATSSAGGSSTAESR